MKTQTTQKKSADLCTATPKRYIQMSSPDENDPHLGSKRRYSEWVKTEGQNISSSRSAKRGDPQVILVRRCIQRCCRDDDLPTAMGAYYDSNERNVKIEAKSFYNLLNLCDGLGNRDVHSGTPTTYRPRDRDDAIPLVPLGERLKFAEEIKSRMDELSIPLVETAYTALVRLFIKAGKLQEAENLLSDAEGTQQCRVKVRLYTPLLTVYCDNGDMMAALKIWARISNQSHTVTEKEYVELLKCATATGCSVVMERVLSDLAEDVLVPSKKATKFIREWFASSHIEKEDKDPTEIEAAKLLETIHNPQAELVAYMGPVTSPENGWEISDRCEIDSATGKLTSGCLEGEFLRPVEVPNRVWNEMLALINKIVEDGELDENRSEFLGGQKGKKRKIDPKFMEERRTHWAKFKQYITERMEDRKIDIVIDGANIGYFKQNFTGAPRHVNYDQVNAVVEHFRKENKAVLLVMHCRHFERNLMPSKYQPLLRSWLDNGVLYRTPHGMDDDWFWMYAALAAGPGTLVVTNDLMRDHHFQTLARRSFVRWQERHQVNFSFDWNTEYQHRLVLSFVYPDIYSRRVQRVADGLVVPHTKIGDENKYLDGTPVVDKDAPKEETYMCIRPRPKVLPKATN